MSRSGKLVDCEEYVSDVKSDVSADFRVVYDVAHCAFPNSVEVKADKLSVSVDYRTA